VKSRASGAEALIALSLGRESNTRFAAGDITTAGDTDVADISLTLAFGKRHASASTTQIDAAALAALVDRTAAMAKLLPEDPEYMPVLGPQTYGPGGNEFDEATASLPNDKRAEAARNAIAGCDAKGVIGAGFYYSSGSERLLATSAGLTAKHRRSIASLSMTVRTPDGTGSGWAGAEEVRARDIDAGAVTRVSVDKAVRSRAPKSLAPGDYTVVLEPAAVANLLGYFLEALDARQTDEGRSFFSKPGGKTKVGEPLFFKRLGLVSNPHDARTPGAAFDGDGTPLKSVSWIENGTLRALRYSRYWAEKKGVPPTGFHGTHELSGGEASSIDDLVKSVKRGLLVTRFWYIRWLEPRELSVTGLTRDGVFLIENGEVTQPVNNFRFNESPAKLFANCREMTKTTWRVPSGDVVRVPALLADRFHMASVSQAV
jgi:predicted Zn-dependent protease